MQHRSPFRALGAVLIALLVAAGCGGSDDEPSAGSTPQVTGASTTSSVPQDEVVRTGGELIVALAGETPTFLPSAGSFSEAGIQIAYTLFDPIAAKGADGLIHPFAAESIVVDDTASEWTVRLRPGLTFHDGTALDAGTMRQIFEEYLTVPGAVTAGDLAQVQEFRVDDELTFTYVLAEPNAAFGDLFTGPVGWPFSVTACREAGEACGERPVGTGPFRVVSWARDDKLIVERNPDYWRTDENGVPLPYLDRIVFQQVPDQSARILAVRSGDVHAGSTSLAEFIRQAREADGVESLEWAGNSGSVTLFNVLSPPLDDLRVRRALYMAVDQEDVIAVMGGDDIVGPKTQIWSTNSPWYSEQAADAWPEHDPEAARALIEEYVADPNRSDGKAPGQPVQLGYRAPGDPALQEIAQFYQAVWGEIGVEVEVLSQDQATLIASVVGAATSEPPFAGEYQVALFRLGGELDPYYILNRQLGDPKSQPFNFTNYGSTTVVEALDTLRTSTDFAERYAASEAIMIELAEQIPWMWQGSIVWSTYVRSEVRNVAGWTIPGPRGGEDIPGAGVANAQPHWSHAWLAAS